MSYHHSHAQDAKTTEGTIIYRPKPRKPEELIQEEVQRMLLSEHSSSKHRHHHQHQHQQPRNNHHTYPSISNRNRTTSLDRRDVIRLEDSSMDDDDGDDYSWEEETDDGHSEYFRGSLLSPPDFQKQIDILSDDDDDSERDEDDEDIDSSYCSSSTGSSLNNQKNKEDCPDFDEDEKDELFMKKRIQPQGTATTQSSENNGQQEEYYTSSSSSEESELEDIIGEKKISPRQMPYNREGRENDLQGGSPSSHNMDEEEEDIKPSGRITPIRDLLNDSSPIQHFIPSGSKIMIDTTITTTTAHHAATTANAAISIPHPQHPMIVAHHQVQPSRETSASDYSQYTTQLVYSDDEDDIQHQYGPFVGYQQIKEKVDEDDQGMTSIRTFEEEEVLPEVEGDPRRWIMLFYVSSLNLISDWVCYSMAPIAVFTEEAYQMTNPENLVVSFLSANVLATMMEPTLLKLIGFRGMTVLGSGLLFVGNLLKSTLVPRSVPLLFVAFFLSGLSQPLYQCTPALLSGNWFPETERTMATGVALNSNQLGIGVAFVVGTILVSKPQDIFPYLNVIAACSALIFIGVVFQFQGHPDDKNKNSSHESKKVEEQLLLGQEEERQARDDNMIAARAPSSTQSSDEIFRQTYDTSSPVQAMMDDDNNNPEYNETSSLIGAVSSREDDYSPTLLRHQHHSQPQQQQQQRQLIYYVSSNSSHNTSFDVIQPQSLSQLHHYHQSYQHPDDTLLFSQSEKERSIRSISSRSIQENTTLLETSLPALLKAYFSYPGFLHTTITFVISAVVINTLSTYMDYLIRLQHEDARLTVGFIGGLFQFIILLSSLFFGKKTDESRAYYTIIMFLLLCGAFALAQCSVYLDSTNQNLRWCILTVAILVGPLQPIASELGVDVTYPLGENGVLVIHQLFANLCSAAFIPVFERFSNMGSPKQMKYTMSFYILVCLHATVTLIFATFNGRYRRLESEIHQKRMSSVDDSGSRMRGALVGLEGDRKEDAEDYGGTVQNTSDLI